MEDDQQFCLRWNNHQTTLIQNFDTLLESGTLVDCTLAAEGKYLKAHKVVLSACSPYFEGLLSEHYDKHPVFILKDVKFKELKAMMDYMYRGEVNISQDQLAALLKAAESLQIKGLSESRTGGNACPKPDTRQNKVSSQPTAPSLDIPHASSGLTIEKNNKVPRQSLAQSSVGDLPEDSASPSIPKGLSSREGSQSPVSRKRKRLRRRSVGEDNSVENHESNSSDMTQANVPAMGIAPVADEKSHADPADSLGRSALMQQLTKPADEMLQLPVEKPEPTEDMIQPKSEYLDDPEESVEDLTLDDDMNDLNEMEDSNRAGPSTHDPSQHPGLAAWHVTGDRSNAGGVVGVPGGPGNQDEVFLAAHEAVQAQRDSQETPLCDWSATPVLLEPLRRSEFDTSDDHYQFATFDCSRCHRQYSSMKSLRRHVFHCGKVVRSALGHTGRIQYFDENGDQRQFVCTYCSKAYRWKKGLKVHQIRCEAKLEQDRRDGRVPEEATEKAIEKATEKATVKATEKATEKYPLETPRAPPEFTNLNIPPVIIKNSTSGRFQCILCRKRYNWLKNLKRHQVVCRQKMLTKQRWKDCKVMLEPLSSESKPNVSAQNFKCVNCGREYRWLKAFKQHQTNCEPKERGNQWNISDTSGTQYDNVIVNVDDVDTDEEVDVVDVKVDVEILDVEEFQSETNLISNQEVKKPSKTQKGLKQDGSGDSYKCALCGNEYKWKKNWKRHYLKCSVGGRHAGAEV